MTSVKRWAVMPSSIDVAAGTDQAQCAVGEFDRLVFVDQAEIVGREVGEDFDLRFERVGDLFVGGESQADVGVGLRESLRRISSRLAGSSGSVTPPGTTQPG